METKNKDMYNDLDEMVVFERPVEINGDTIYGFIKCSGWCNDNELISRYVSYLVGAERLEKQKCDDRTLWLYSLAIPSNQDETLGYHVFKFDQAIEWLDGEIDKYEGTPCFILKKELIDRYTKNRI